MSTDNTIISVHSKTIEPLNYSTPPWPSLYWPFPVNGPQGYYLYHGDDVWRFTLYWTLVFFGALHLATAGYAVFVQLVGTAGRYERKSHSKPTNYSESVDGELDSAEQADAESEYRGTQGWRGYRRTNWRFIWIVPLVYAFMGFVEALIAGSVVGGLLGGVYTAGYFQMSTWIPFVWALISALILVLSSFAVQGGL